ncbi:SURF1 family protein [Corynebacterium breve]|uniref:SURF1-like protein n=1 Tax=Corynebacterium breve TaxID=3049799 RepID=A0ABY8VFP1_9CORY|nr:SURF1 family protein [Corynebacterium breve]WIM67039.1 SURF1 family protein [Corynebacterium breve]
MLIVIFSYFAFTFLAPWQLGKNEAIVERNERIEHAFEVDPVPVTDLVAADGTFDRDTEWSRVTMTGRYLPDDEVLLRLRPVETHPAYQALTPFETDNGLIILVNRGWVPAVDGTKIGDLTPAPTSQVTVSGLLRVDEGVHHNAPLIDEGKQQVYSINTEQIAQLTGTDIAEPLVQLSPEQPGVLNPMPLPQLERGNHLSYGLQWIAFGVMAPIGLLYFIWSEVKERRRVREEEAELNASLNDDSSATGLDPHPEDLPTPVPAESTVQSQRMRNRYGDARKNHWDRNAKKNQERI